MTIPKPVLCTGRSIGGELDATRLIGLEQELSDITDLSISPGVNAYQRGGNETCPQV